MLYGALIPWISGRSAFGKGLDADQWRSFGALLSRAGADAQRLGNADRDSPGDGVRDQQSTDSATAADLDRELRTVVGGRAQDHGIGVLTAEHLGDRTELDAEFRPDSVEQRRRLDDRSPRCGGERVHATQPVGQARRTRTTFSDSHLLLRGRRPLHRDRIGRRRTHEPQWFRNLRKAEQAVIEVGADRMTVDVAIADDAEHKSLWAKLLAKAPFFGKYEGKAGRVIPMAALTPRK